MKFHITLFATAAFATLAATATLAFASDGIDPALQAKVTAQLTAQGYDVRKVQMEDGMIEVYAVKDGETSEIYLNDKLEIVKNNGEDQG
jgi:hypothetical protein